MTKLNVASSWFNRMATNPPMWMRCAYVPIFAGMAFAVIQRRGWVIGVVAAVVYGGIGLAVAINPTGVVAWSRSHPKTDGAIFGPLLFLALAYLTHLSLWWCLLSGALGVALGAARGVQRGRFRNSRNDQR